MAKHSVLGVLVDAVEPQEAVTRVLHAARQGAALAVSALATHGVMTGVQDPEHRYRLNSLDLVVPDGQPVRWTLNCRYGLSLRERVYGPALMLSLCEAAALEGLPIFLYGSTENVVQTLRHELKARFPGLIVAGLLPSRFRNLSEAEEQEIASLIKESGARIVFVGMGCPRQEIWVYENRERVGVPLLAVGAAFDFHARLKPQAPVFLQRAGLEWLFRFCCEPKRLFLRTFGLYPKFLWLSFLQFVGLKRFDPSAIRPPGAPVRLG